MIPDYLPQLRTGTGETPKDGGCLVQVAGFLYDGHSWRDDVACVHPVLREAGIQVNDALDEPGLRRLSLLAARISGSADAVAGWSDEQRHRLDVALAFHCAMSVNGPESDLRVQAALGLVEDWLDGDVSVTKEVLAAAGAAAYAAARAAAYAAAGDAAYAAAAVERRGHDLVAWYEALIDEYDRLTGRTSHNLTPEQGHTIRTLLGA